MNRPFIEGLAFLLSLAGPIICYRAAARGQMPTRLKVLAWSAAGGAAAGITMTALLLFVELVS